EMSPRKKQRATSKVSGYNEKEPQPPTTVVLPFGWATVNDDSTAPTIANLHDQLAPYALWIDGVGGYLVCLSHRVTLGQSLVDTLVIGPAEQLHVAAPDMTQPLILLRTKSGLSARWSGNMLISGKTYQERGPLEPGATLTTDQISLTLERKTH